MDLAPGALGLDDLRRIGAGPVRLRLPDEAWQAVDASAAAVRRVLDAGTTVYGINTGFGRLARQRIDATQLQELQRRLLLSHAAGVGPPLPEPVVRRILALKVNALAQAHSGVRPELLRLLLGMLAADVLPVVPAQGSVGASGDLAPLAHLSLPLIGEGEASVGGALLPGGEALRRVGLEPLTLAAKEGLALLNGTQVSTALAATGLYAIADCFAAAVVAGALSVDAAMGSTTPFDVRIQALRGHPGQTAVAALYRDLLAGSEIRESHIHCDRVQDPYSLRCQPQVMGACLDQLRQAARSLAVEANAVSDNPLVFAETGEVLSGGNFHGQPVAFAADNLALAAAEIGSLSERRLALLLDPAMNSGLPAFLVEEGGLNSGFMLVQVTAAALVAENRTLATPASIDSIPTSANQEDHVAMATHAARRLLAMADNLAAIVACELLGAAQGVALRAPLRTSPRLTAELEAIRRISPPLCQDRSLSGELRQLAGRILAGDYHRAMAAPVLDATLL